MLMIRTMLATLAVRTMLAIRAILALRAILAILAILAMLAMRAILSMLAIGEGTCTSADASVANHCTNWKIASLCCTKESESSTAFAADLSRPSLVVPN